MTQLVVPSFGGGIVLAGSVDAKKTDELQACDSFDLGPRGQLVAASDYATYTTFRDNILLAASGIYGMTVAPLSTASGVRALVAGTGTGTLGVDTVLVWVPLVEGESSPYDTFVSPNPAVAPITTGFACTFATFPFVSAAGAESNIFAVNFGARQSVNTRTGGGLYYFLAGGSTLYNSGQYDALGTGPGSEYVVGTLGKRLYFRGIAAYNNHLFGWGFHNLEATTGNSANRLMFSNTGKPLMWGNDNLGAVGVDRLFSDTDAILIGGSGEVIRACVSWNQKLMIGTNKELHYLQGYGRESFLTDGASQVKKSTNVVGPHAMIEGPDGLLYGVSTEGMWAYDGQTVEPLYRNLVNYAGKSPGFWDLIWTDSTRAAGYPGTTNQDLVWMVSDPESRQVWAVIPYCNATLGYGVGTDTVIVKYHTETGGFSRQVITGVALTHGTLARREPTANRHLFACTPTASNLRRYGYKSGPSVSPVMPTALPTVTAGPYAPFGPHGLGINRVAYATVAWESASSLPIVLSMTPTVDDQALGAVKVSIQSTTPAGPADGDLWLDTSGTDTNLGNATAGVNISAASDYVLKSYSTSRLTWRILPHGGQKGLRATIRMAYQAARGTRVQLQLSTVSAVGRFQVEALGLEPSASREAA